MKNFKISAIICAAGKGERAGFAKNKLLSPIFGAPALFHTLEKFAIPEIDEVVIASSEEDLEEISALASPFGFMVVTGGKTRFESVKNCLFAVTGDIVLVHDGARPYVSREIILTCIESVKKHGSGVCAIKATDTSVYCENGQITQRTDRDKLYRLQTPQGFFTKDLRLAYEKAGDGNYTDDSAVYGKFIAPPVIIEGSESNIKLTYRQDFFKEVPPLPAVGCKIGFGVDTHAFGEGNSVTLAGVKIPCDRGLIAHSDGDVIAHAVMDALLSAAGLKDIGHYFPDSDDKYSGADSICLLAQTCKIIRERGYAPSNISITVQAEKPRLSQHIENMTLNVANACGLSKDNCAIAAGTCEGLGFVGKGLGITAYCAVMLTDIKG